VARTTLRESQLARAREACRDGDFQTAYAIYDRLLGAGPDDAEVLREYGRARYAEYADLEGAARLFERALAVEPRSVEALLWLGDVASLGYGPSYAGAAQSYRTATHLDPQAVDAYGGLGMLHRSPGTPVSAAEAVEALRTAAQLDPHRADARAGLGMLLLEQGDRSGALDASRAAQRLLAEAGEGSRAAALQSLVGRLERGEPATTAVLFNDSPRLRWPGRVTATGETTP
jgi:tetratricopeptide (TPR) repeat protein